MILEYGLLCQPPSRRSRRSDSEGLSDPRLGEDTGEGVFGRPGGLTARLRACSAGGCPGRVVGAGSGEGDGGPSERSRAVREKAAPARAARHVLAGPGLALLPSLFSLTGALIRGGGTPCGRRGAFDACASRVLPGRSGRLRSRAERADRLVVSRPLPRSAAERAPERRAASGGRPSRLKGGGGEGSVRVAQDKLGDTALSPHNALPVTP